MTYHKGNLAIGLNHYIRTYFFFGKDVTRLNFNDLMIFLKTFILRTFLLNAYNTRSKGHF